MRKPIQKKLNLALQGGGSHGAFAWGAIDALLEDGRIEFEGISATSAGAINAVGLAQGLLNNDRDEARETLEGLWKTISDIGAQYSPFKNLIPDNPMTKAFTAMMGTKSGGHSLEQSPMYAGFDLMTRTFSPYQFNPANFNPLRNVLLEKINFEAIKNYSKLKLKICATNVETCKVKIFNNNELSVDAILASTCLPMLFQSAQVDGQYYWDGGYIGNPAIFPLIYDCQSPDVLIVHINPIVRQGVPQTAGDILNRLNEISFNSSLMREMRAIAFVSKLIEDGLLDKKKMKTMLIHSIRSDEEMADYDVSSKLNTDWTFLTHLRDRGRTITQEWLTENHNKIGKQSSVDIHKEFL